MDGIKLERALLKSVSMLRVQISVQQNAVETANVCHGEINFWPRKIGYPSLMHVCNGSGGD